MKKAFKVIGKFLVIILLLMLLFLFVVFICNKIMLKKEEPLLARQVGNFVEVDGHKMNVYTEGKGEHTLVFLSGSGTVSPVLDFKSLYSLLSDEFKIVVIEKFGYGFSDVVDTERSFETILRQDREALEKLGIKEPFILCPHSMSGLEALMWAQNYPDEIEGIIGLDMVLPRNYDNFDFKNVAKVEKLAVLARKAGIIRFYYSDKTLPEKLSKNEKQIYKALAAIIAVNIDVYNEGKAIPEACKIIDSKPIPDIPILLYVSDGKETQALTWVQNQRDFAAANKNVKIVELNCGHYVHNFEYERISRGVKEFVEE